MAKELFSQEYTIKAAFVYNFAKFIEYPLPSSPSPYFNICIFGSDPFGEKIESINGKTIGPRHVRVRRIKSIEELQNAKECQILFISKSKKHNISEILHKIYRQPIVTIAEQKNAAQLGVVINLIVVDQKVRFEINNKAALNTGIKISSGLLNLATNVLE